MVIALILWGVFFHTQLKADELNCETFVKEEICKMPPEEQEAWFWELFRSLMEDEKQERVEILEA